MSSPRANTTLLGVFVLLAGVLAVASVVFFGSVNLFARPEPFVVYFSEGLSGLAEGAAVKYKGVTVGRVTEIKIAYDQDEAETTVTPVFFEIDMRYLRDRLGFPHDLADRNVLLREIRRGLRAQLQMENLISGLLFVDIRYYAEPTPTRFFSRSQETREFPTQTSDLAIYMEQARNILEGLQQVDFGTIGTEVTGAVVALRRGIEAVDFAGLNSEAQAILGNVRQQVEQIDLPALARRLDATLADVQAVARRIDGQVEPISGELRATLQSLRTTLDEINGLVAGLNTAADQVTAVLRPESTTRGELDRALRQISGVASSLNTFLEFLERNPNALLTGRSREASNP